MILDEERKFIVFWQKNRDLRRKKSYMILSGLPYGIFFSIPIMINFMFGRFWYKRADAVGMSQSNTFVLLLAIFLISTFIAFFYKQYQWEQNEQRFLELQEKIRKESLNNKES